MMLFSGSAFWMTQLAAVPAAVSAEARSFASAFFVSRNASGDIEVLGTGVTWFLLALSMTAMAMAISMAMQNRREMIMPDEVAESIRKDIAAKKFQQAIASASASDSFLGQIMADALRQSPHGWDAVLRTLEQSSEEHAVSRLRRIDVLNIIGQVSPMIGLFGTVYGMIMAFSAIVASGGAADPVMLAGGIGTALTTTFWGLVVAIPSLAVAALLRGRIDALTAEATLVAEDLLSRFRPGKARLEEATDH